MKYFKIYSNCIFVKGINRSIIVDTQLERIQLIPNDLYEILAKTEFINLENIYIEYGLENQNTINNYFKKLIEEDWGFYCNEEEKSWFPKMSLEFSSPFLIDNCILEELYEVEKFKIIISQLENLQCQFLEIVLYNKISNDLLINILSLFNKSTISRISLVIKYDDQKNIDFIKYLSSTFLRIIKIIIHSAQEDKKLDFYDFNVTDITLSKLPISSFKFCGIVDLKYLTPNIYHFSESINHNTCLNRKISIDKDGNIKNCPSMAQSFGNIKDTTLEEALNHPNFKRYWNITKDQIEVCKDCEFRHICTDCRAYIEEPDNQYSKPLKCGYNPYTNVWEEWSTNPLKQMAIEYYGMQELVKKDA